MTFMIILGAIAGLYTIALLLRLTAIALPLYAGIGVGFWFLDRGNGYATSIAAGFVTGVLVLFVGRFLCETLPPPFRGLVAVVFAVPAGFAGYQAASGLAELAPADGAALTLLGVLGALTAAIAAWRSLVAPRFDHQNHDIPMGNTSNA